MPDNPVAVPHANRLASETSPYLQQHAHNPVDWYPWGEEALNRAAEEDLPILLSVGYSACHWCHVMERESFENSEIAAQMNARFVNIKVDREERPDVDEIYMSAVQAMTGQGGWPMTVFLTPDLRPFHGGTYYPPEDSHGRPGFRRVLQAVSEHYARQRDRVEDQAEKLRSFLRQNADPLDGGDDLDDDRCQDILDAAVQALIDQHDGRCGGFSLQGPKFPNSAALSLLLRHWHATGDDAVLQVAVHTLTHMARGGIFDQLGGGFHRYSVDERWLVPHFEKMLYDNALLVPVYVDAWQATGKPLFGRVVRETLDYVVREMTSAEGGYCAAQDADSEGEEGRFFVWTPEAVEDVIDDEHTAKRVCAYYDITPEGNFEGDSVLHVSADIDEQARLLGVSRTELQSAIDDGRRRLFEARAWRCAPGRDDKVLAAWNGLMISAMARGYEAFGESAWLDSATMAARFLLEHLVVDGSLRHGWKDGQASVHAFQDDYAALVGGLVDLYEATFEPRWLASAVDLAEQMIERFWDTDGEGGFYYAEADRSDLIVRTKNPFDGATPSGNSLAALALLRLATLTDVNRFRDCAEATLRAYGGLLQSSPLACCHMACALSQFRCGPLELTFMGAAEARRPFLRTTHESYLPNRVISGAETASDDSTTDLLPLLRERHLPADGSLHVYVCRNSSCSAPLTDVAEFSRTLAPDIRAAG
ncbi:MAG: thioredoxin domain-containing protein [Candidatus Latescibacteria bacterium]|nr:thioredoxin domain-containing protein [Gemmatimonadaceae bacterium]MDP6018310.1 thioredoxin domain-containing protein [Candidatus Latescibacterota bacterium]MDP7447477.1 thioredoxin domain-containing protein [Candidatus Latescibacterota bacterium]HJP29057.1 thioredoxin domain-containing protein [Candidatus Latescibacterota bacterium]